MDFDKLSVNCDNKSKCQISGKGNWEPTVPLVKCSRNRWNPNDDAIEAWPRGSTTKACGPFFKAFPKAYEAGIQASCTRNACFLTGPPGKNFYLHPYTKVACQRRTWRVKKKVVQEPDSWTALSFEEYEERGIGNKPRSESLISCKGISLWDHIEGSYTDEFHSLAKAKCQPDAKGKNLECWFFCPPVSAGGAARQIRHKFKCNMAKGTWGPKMNSAIAKSFSC